MRVPHGRFAVLGLEKDATLKDIKKKYRRRSLTFMPVSGGVSIDGSASVGFQ